MHGKAEAVDHPAHYQAGKIEAIDVMEALFGREAVKGFCICNAFKYVWRHEAKNGMEDIRKADWYLRKYIELEGKEGNGRQGRADRPAEGDREEKRRNHR